MNLEQFGSGVMEQCLKDLIFLKCLKMPSVKFLVNELVIQDNLYLFLQ